MAKTPRNAPQKLPDNMMLNGSNTLPAQIEIGDGKSVQLGEVVMLAFQKSGLQPEAWNELPEAERDSALSDMIENMTVAAAGVGGDTGNDLSSATGPIAQQEIRYRGRTYAPGERLPTDIDDKTLDLLDDLDAI